MNEVITPGQLADALESGKWNPTTRLLVRWDDTIEGSPNPVGHCCLGVACNMAGMNDWDMGNYHMPKADWTKYMTRFPWMRKRIQSVWISDIPELPDDIEDELGSPDDLVIEGLLAEANDHLLSEEGGWTPLVLPILRALQARWDAGELS